MFKKTLSLIAISLSFLTACGGSTPVLDDETSERTESEPIKIVTTFAPLYSFATNIAGDQAEVSNLVPPGTSVHVWEPKPSDLVTLSGADLIIMNGLELEPFMTDMLEATQNTGARIVVTSDSVESMLMETPDNSELGVEEKEESEEGEEEENHEHEEGEGHEDEHEEAENHEHEDNKNSDAQEVEEDHEHQEEEEHEHEGDEGTHEDDDETHDEEHEDHEHEADEGHDHHHHDGLDPHIWLNPQMAMVQVEAIADALVEIDPDHKEVYRNNEFEYMERLGQLDQEIAQQLSQLKPKNFIVFHDAYTYFLNAYDLADYRKAAVEAFPGKEPTSAYFKDLLELIENEAVQIIFTEPQFSPATVENLKEETDIETLAINPIGLELSPQAYENNMRNLTDAFVSAFE